MPHDFTLILADLPAMTDEAANRLWEAGCEDTTPGSSQGASHVAFHREADSLEAAIASAIADVKKAGYRVARVESDEALTIDRFNQQLQSH